MNLCGFGIHAFYRARDIRDKWYNHRYPATMQNKTLSPKESVTKHPILVSAPHTTYDGFGEDLVFMSYYYILSLLTIPLTYIL